MVPRDVAAPERPNPDAGPLIRASRRNTMPSHGMLDLLFVYGTLRRDVPNSKFAPLLAGEARLVARGRTQGRLFDLGNYPGFIDRANDDSQWVRGEVYAVRTPEDTLARLDDYEGCGASDPPPHPYHRAQREVVLDTGERIVAWVYVYKRSLRGRAEIPGGDYATWATGSL